MDKRMLCLLPVFLILLGAGCSQQPAVPSSPAETIPANTVVINRFAFGPQTLTVPANTTVTWQHNDAAAHTIVSGTIFTSPTLQRGDNFSFTFTTPGTYDYYCGIHPAMRGIIIVE